MYRKPTEECYEYLKKKLGGLTTKREKLIVTSQTMLRLYRLLPYLREKREHNT